MPKNHPIQPLEPDEHGVVRFKKNAIVRYLLDKGPFDMNHLAVQGFSREDKEQFAQLIGSELGYVRGDTYDIAHQMSLGNDELEARITVLEEKLAEARKGLKKLVPILFNIHPDDLEP